MGSIPTTRASYVVPRNAGDDFFQFIGEGGNVIGWIDSNAVGWGGLATSNNFVTSSLVTANLAISGSAAVAPIFTLTDTNANLGQNTSSVIGMVSSAAAAPGTFLNFNQYGDGTVGFELFKANSPISGWTLDVTNGGAFDGYTKNGSVVIGYLGAKGFSCGFGQGLQQAIGDILQAVPPNSGEVSWTAGGKTQAYMGVPIPLNNYGTNNVDTKIVATGDNSNFNSAILTTLIYSANGAVTIASAAVSTGVVTLTTTQNIPSCWMVGSLITVTGITSTGGNWNAANVAITAIGVKTVSYVSITASGVATTSQGVVVPVNGGLTATNFFTNNNTNNTYISSATHSGGTVQINFGGNGINSQMVAGKVVVVSGFQGDPAINGTWVITASSGIDGGAIQYSVPGSGSPTLGATGTAFVTVPKYYMGGGLYNMVGYAVAQGVGSGNTSVITVTYTDESGAASTTQTASATFQAQGDRIMFDFVLNLIGASDVKIALSASGTIPTVYSLTYRLAIY